MYFLQGAQQLVAIISLVMARETDDRHFLVIFILCIHITNVIIFCIYFQNNVYFNNNILNYAISMLTPPKVITLGKLLFNNYIVALSQNKLLIFVNLRTFANRDVQTHISFCHNKAIF